MKFIPWQLILSASAALLTLFPVSAKADQVLTYSVKKITLDQGKSLGDLKTSVTTGKAMGTPHVDRPLRDAGDTKPPSKTTMSERKITLSKDAVTVEDNNDTVIYDFARKRILTLDSQKREYSDIDLHSTVYFRVTELQNRSFLSDVTSKAGVQPNIFDSFDTESLFSLMLPGGTKQATVETKLEGGKTQFEHAGVVVASYEASATPIDNSAKAGYRRYLANATPLHPLIRMSLLSQCTFPQRLMYKTTDGPFTQTTVEYTLQSALMVPSASAGIETPAGYKLIRDKHLTPIYEALDKLGQNPKLPDKETVAADAYKLLKSGNALDAVLTVLEYALSSGDQMTPVMRKIAPTANQDPKCISFFQNSSPQTIEEARTSVKALEAIDRSNLSRGYIIDIHCANIYEQLQDNGKAIQLMTRVLTLNPLITGAYHDLGKMYLADYETPTGWECFRLARKITPGHPLMQEVTELERGLEKDFPDFF